MKPFTWDFSKLRLGDIALCRSVGPVGTLIRLTTWSDYNHAFWIADLYGQWIGIEMNARGGNPIGLTNYCTAFNQVIKIWRWQGFEDITKQEKLRKFLSRMLRKRYDDSAFWKVPHWMRWAWRKKDTGKEMVCSESIARGLVNCDFYPPQGINAFINFPQSPEDLDKTFIQCTDMDELIQAEFRKK